MIKPLRLLDTTKYSDQKLRQKSAQLLQKLDYWNKKLQWCNENPKLAKDKTIKYLLTSIDRAETSLDVIRLEMTLRSC